MRRQSKYSIAEWFDDSHLARMINGARSISSNRWPARTHARMAPPGDRARDRSIGRTNQATNRTASTDGSSTWSAGRERERERIEAVQAQSKACTAALWPHDGDDGVGEPAPGDARGRHEPLGPLGRELALAVDQLHRHPLRRVALLHLGRSRAVVGGARA
jgi:hypothetical protein